MGEERTVLLFGGLGGLLAGVLIILSVIVILALVPPVADATEAVMKFPEVRAAFSVFSSLSLGAIILTLLLFLALYRGLRGTSLALSLFGVVLGVLALPLAATSSVSNFTVFPVLSDLYHASGATPEEQATVVLLWQATQGINSSALFVAILFFSLSFIALGVAMLGSRDFGMGFGWVSVVLGVAGLLVTALTLVLFIPFALGSIPFLVFIILFGGKVYSLSRAA